MQEKFLSQLYLKDTAFEQLMGRRVYNVLLIASPYDAFMMEEDGRVEEQLHIEYSFLNLSSPPRFTRVSTYAEALAILKEKDFNLVIAMPGVELSETFDYAKIIKKEHPNTPFVVLTPFSRKVSCRLEGEDMSGVDFVFSWLGNVDLLLAIIKLMEDEMNAEDDILGVGVQVILLVEDSVRFYSSMLPVLYKFLLRQSKEFATEALNEHEQMLRMRGRPKVLMARSYEEAKALFDKYEKHILGLITDVRYPLGGVQNAAAGLEFTKYVREKDHSIPVIVQSAERYNINKAQMMECTFIDKNSKTFPRDLGKAIMRNFGFGDFVIRDPKSNKVLFRLKNLKDLQNHVFQIPDEALLYHASYNDISRWLYSRAMFPIAEIMREHHFASIDEAPAVRQLIFDLIVKYRKMKNRGVVAIFHRNRFDNYSNFARIGQGSLGGKGRGLAFIDSIIKKNPECDNLNGVTLNIPKTIVLCTDIFDEFMETNNLYEIALQEDKSDDEILLAFLAAELPKRLHYDFVAMFDIVKGPLAIRSSSLLEDSHYQPFAGVYSTYMIPYSTDRRQMAIMLGNAIKGVYASVFFSESKQYMTATRNVIDQEKMAVIIQEVVGATHTANEDGKGKRMFFPSFSGVGRSLNYYPINHERAEDGVAEVAIGLGKYIVDGGQALRFSPRHPNSVLQTSTMDLALRDTQTRLMAIDMDESDNNFKADDGFNIRKVRVQDFASTGALKYMVSTFDYINQRINDNDLGDGRRVVTFANMLQHNAFPLAESIDFMLKHGAQAMGRPVEIEFAGNVDEKGEMKGEIYWLQIRPIVDRREMLDETLLDLPDEKLLMRCTRALGHGMMDNITEIVMVKDEAFSMSNNSFISREIEKINAQMLREEKNYVLIGPGRWGSSDTALGVPVKWANIAAAKLIVETSLPNYGIEPSQGTHFFQNLTSFGVGYFSIDDKDTTSMLNRERLQSLPVIYETDNVIIYHLDVPLKVCINGKLSKGIVTFCEESNKSNENNVI